jgi:hypothetical protein
MKHPLALVRCLRACAVLGSTVAVVSTFAACGEDLSEEIPTAPNMSALVGAYTEPNGTLTADTTSSLANALAGRFAAFEGVGGLDFLGGIIGGLGGGGGGALTYEGDANTDVREQPAQIGGTSLEGSGYLKIHHICKGWGAGLLPNKADGKADLIATFSDAGVAPVIWGALSSCKYLLNDGQVLFNSAIRIHTGGSFQGETVGGVPEFLFDLEGAVDLNGAPLLTKSERLDFRVTGGGLEIRLPVADGDVVFYQTVDTSCTDNCGQILGFRAGNGDFLCDATTSICSNGNVEFPFSFVGL